MGSQLFPQVGAYEAVSHTGPLNIRLQDAYHTRPAYLDTPPLAAVCLLSFLIIAAVTPPTPPPMPAAPVPAIVIVVDMAVRVSVHAAA